MPRLFRAKYIDPPWYETGGGKVKRGADRHYKCLKTHDIIRVIYQSGVWRPDPKGCHLWLWVTNNFLEDGLFVMKALGFRYVNKVTWNKVKDGKPQKGLGQYFFGSDEVLLFGVMGKMKTLKKYPTQIDAPRTPVHSEKPKVFRDMVQAASPGPRLEMFARGGQVRGWTRWGDGVRL